MTDDVEQWWRELDTQQQQLAIYSELRQIRETLQSESPQEATEQMFECTRCEAVVKRSERSRHAQKAHKAPPDMIDELFTEK